MIDFDRLTYYRIPKDVIEEFRRRFEDAEKIPLPSLNDAEKFEIYKFLFKRIQIFLEYSQFFKEREEKEWTPSGVYTKKELAELKQAYKRDMMVMTRIFEAAGLEGDWILRKIVGSPEKMESFKEQLLEGETE